jgi:hypothetical protein
MFDTNLNIPHVPCEQLGKANMFVGEKLTKKVICR